MNLIGSAFHSIIVVPILNILVLLHQIFLMAHIPGAFGFAIITFTFLVRLAMQPLFHKQMHTAKKMQELKPHLDKLQAKHKGDAKRLQAEQLKLYQEHGLNPASGCLFLIIQLPILIGVYQTLSQFVHSTASPKLVAAINKDLYFPFLKIQSINPHFLWYNLGVTPQKSGLWFYYLIPVVTALLQYFQAQVSMTQSNPTAIVPAKKSDKENKSSNTEDFQKAMNLQMKFFFPAMIGYIAFTLPVGLALYWNIFSIFSILQYVRMKGKEPIMSSGTP
jgi:YidC/Oxa1 family membrane protein insertase